MCVKPASATNSSDFLMVVLPQILGIGRQDVVRQNGFGLDDSVWITIKENAFYDTFQLPCLPVFDADILGANVLKVRVIRVPQSKTVAINLAGILAVIHPSLFPSPPIYTMI